MAVPSPDSPLAQIVEMGPSGRAILLIVAAAGSPGGATLSILMRLPQFRSRKLDGA